MKHWIIFSLVVTIIMMVIGYRFLSNEFVYIALAGPMTGEDQEHGKAMLQGVELYLDEINQKGGIHGKKVKLLKFDEQNKTCGKNIKLKQCAKIAANQVVDSPALAVIGHYSSEPTLEASGVYKEKGIPAITGTATADEITKLDEKWYFRIIFKNNDQAAVVANYAHKILDYENAYIFYDNDSYGRGLENSFSETAARIGLNINNKWNFGKQTSFKTALNNMIDNLKNADSDGILFLATHSTEAIKVIRELRRLPYKLPIIGADALSSNRFTQTLKKNYPQEQLYPGYYTDGIYVVSPFLLDIAGKRAQDFYLKFKKKYNKTAAVTSALYYDATIVAVEAIKKMLVEEEITNIKEQRKKVKDNLRQISRLENAVEGVTGYIYFDSNGDSIKSIPIGIYKKGQPVTAWYQYQPLSWMQEEENLLQNILNNNVIQVNDKFMQKAQVVYTGIDFNDISELDLNKSIFKADFYIWFRFFQEGFNNTENDFTNINFTNTFDPKDNKKGILVESDEYIPKQGSKNGKVIIESYRSKTPFKVSFELHDYPLDKQILPIRFQHNKLTTDKLIYVIDREGIKLDKQQKIFPSWKIMDDGISFFQDTQKNDSTLGNPKRFDSQKRLEYSQFNVEIKIERHVLSFILKTLLPTVFVLGLGYAVYFTSAFATKMALSINVIIATSLFHLKLSSSALASVNYNVLIEYVFYMVYMLGIFGVIAALLIHKEEAKISTKKDKLDKFQECDGFLEEEFENVKTQIRISDEFIERIEKTGRIGYPLIIIFSMSIIWVFYF
ncbi:ABC transporter substrate-binding protein [Candidatus Halobeggiatoa sp. HSG11]|nr:ABC transporter substrate-binding protein [Candidatus Halobeggiatoa sp. HSG11]